MSGIVNLGAITYMVGLIEYLCQTISTTNRSVPELEGNVEPIAMAASDSLASFDIAFMKLKQSVNPVDAVTFQSTTLEDVWKAALAIQQRQRESKSTKNMRRIEPFLRALEKYSKSIEILCNGTPYLPWIWVWLRMHSQDNRQNH
jgi:hypothetical protein